MALHWQEIKGFNGTTSSNLLYTYIKFQKKENSTLTHELNRPHILLGSSDLGYILCNNINNYLLQNLYTGSYLKFYTNTNFTGDYWNLWGTTNSLALDIKGSSGDTGVTIRSQSTGYSTDTLLYVRPKGIELTAATIKLMATMTKSDCSNIDHDIELSANTIKSKFNHSAGNYLIQSSSTLTGAASMSWISIGTDNSNYKYRFLNDKFITDLSIHATYFNALSDRRSKNNITPLTTSVLKVIQKTPVYSFNYKNNNLPSIGLMAQDLVDVDLNGFNLVDNKQATGENNDYMHIHESKLVYVLWKAIQELTIEVETLKKELNK